GPVRPGAIVAMPTKRTAPRVMIVAGCRVRRFIPAPDALWYWDYSIAVIAAQVYNRRTFGGFRVEIPAKGWLGFRQSTRASFLAPAARCGGTNIRPDSGRNNRTHIGSHASLGTGGHDHVNQCGHERSSHDGFNRRRGLHLPGG